MSSVKKLYETVGPEQKKFRAALDALAAKNGGRVPLAHATRRATADQIAAGAKLTASEGSFEARDRGVYATVGHEPDRHWGEAAVLFWADPSDVMPDPNIFGDGTDDSDDTDPDVRNKRDWEPYCASLLESHPDLIGAEVIVYLEAIEPDEIEGTR